MCPHAKNVTQSYVGFSEGGCVTLTPISWDAVQKIIKNRTNFVFCKYTLWKSWDRENKRVGKLWNAPKTSKQLEHFAGKQVNLVGGCVNLVVPEE